MIRFCEGGSWVTGLYTSQDQLKLGHSLSVVGTFDDSRLDLDLSR